MKKKISAALVAGVMSAAMAVSLASCGNSAKVKVVDAIELTAEEYAVGVNKEDAELLASINTLFATMEENGEMESLINSYFDGTSTFTYTNTTSEKDEKNLVLATKPPSRPSNRWTATNTSAWTSSSHIKSPNRSERRST